MMARMEMDYEMDFLGKLSRLSLFQIVKFGLEIFDILHICRCNTKFLQEIAFFYLVRVFQLLFHKFREHFLHL